MSTRKPVVFVVLGEPASKANQRRLVTIRGEPAFIKSSKALAYVDAFQMQCPQLAEPLTCDVAVYIKIYYATRRPDLDESVILDCMQSVVQEDKRTGAKVVLRNNIYLNDRQVREKHVFWGLDRENPRAEIRVEALE